MRRTILTGFLGGAAVASLALGACGDDDSETGGDGLDVVASTTIVADWVQNVGGEHVDVTSIVPRETDVHSYIVVPGDIQRIGDADIVFLVGESLEGSFEGAIEANAKDTVVELAHDLELQPFPEGLAHEDEGGDAKDDEHSHGGLDPHIYMDIDLAIAAVEHIRDALAEADPANRDDYEANAQAYVGQLRKADEEIAARLSGLPENRRFLVTFHDAYGYFTARYGLELLGFVVESPEEQPSAEAIAHLVDEIKEHDVEFIFTEPQFDAKIVEQLADDTGAEVRVIPSDALSGDYPDYVSFLKAIADGIAR